MSNTPIQIATDLSKILEQINTKLDKIDSKFEAKFDKLDERLNKIEIGQARLEGEIKALETKVGELGKQIDDQKFINRGILIGLVVAILGGAAKLFGWVDNP